MVKSSYSYWGSTHTKEVGVHTNNNTHGSGPKSTCTNVATNSTHVPHKVRWPQEVHVPLVLDAVASYAQLAQLV